MKAILTLTLVVSFGISSFGQDVAKESKVEITASNVVLKEVIEIETVKETEVARVYMFKNSRIKKELAFRTKRNRSKMA